MCNNALTKMSSFMIILLSAIHLLFLSSTSTTATNDYFLDDNNKPVVNGGSYKMDHFMPLPDEAPITWAKSNTSKPCPLYVILGHYAMDESTNPDSPILNNMPSQQAAVPMSSDFRPHRISPTPSLNNMPLHHVVTPISSDSHLHMISPTPSLNNIPLHHAVTPIPSGLRSRKISPSPSLKCDNLPSSSSIIFRSHTKSKYIRLNSKVDIYFDSSTTTNAPCTKKLKWSIQSTELGVNTYYLVAGEVKHRYKGSFKVVKSKAYGVSDAHRLVYCFSEGHSMRSNISCDNSCLEVGQGDAFANRDMLGITSDSEVKAKFYALDIVVYKE